MELWTITEPGVTFASSFYFTREEAEAALANARRRDCWRPHDIAALARQQVERIVLDEPTPSQNSACSA
jgi:hypothetical protein